ncbi:MAG: lactate racemase domain-containing protein [Candidatus Korobacteraceae bacterium]
MRLHPVSIRLEGGDYALPKMFWVEQHFDRTKVDNVSQTLRSEIDLKVFPETVREKKIAVAVGSRGIDNLALITRTVLDRLKSLRAAPYIVPAMGSHGGATAAGQRAVLAAYGITEQSMGVPICASMDTLQIAEMEDGMPVFCDRMALEADGIVPINRIKPHADFKADYESGLVKMIAIGLAKHKGATAVHNYGFDRFCDLLPKIGKVILKNVPILFGVAILENAYDETMHIEVVPRDQILNREKELLCRAKANLARLNLSSIDVLIIEKIGKEISGEGMDPNVTGRPGSGLPGFDAPPVQKIVVLGISGKSHGNGVGIGMADITTLRCVSQIDFSAMYVNAITSTLLEPAKIPVTVNTDREAIDIALRTCTRVTPETIRVVRIKSTLDLHQIQISESYRQEICERDNLSVVAGPQQLQFTEDGWLI